MILFNQIHPSWNSIRNHLYTEPLTTLFNEVLPSISSQPKESQIFKALEMPVKDVKVVVLRKEPLDYPYKDDFTYTPERFTKQGVLFLNAALTVETQMAGSHKEYWDKWTQALIGFLSRKNPCIWILWGLGVRRFIPYIKNPFVVVGYDKYTINKIPAMENSNYIFLPEEKHRYDFANKILIKTKNVKISW